MRVVLDTNVIVSGMLWGGKPRLLLMAMNNDLVRGFANEFIYAELTRVFSRPKFAAQLRRINRSPTELVLAYRAQVITVDTLALPKQICRDPDDDWILSCAGLCRADVLVTGDQDLLALKSFHGTWIKTADETAQWLNIDV